MARLIQWGEVRWYRFRRPDKKRPVLILTRQSALDFLGEVTVAPVTSTIREIPSEVLLTRRGSAPDPGSSLAGTPAPRSAPRRRAVRAYRYTALATRTKFSERAV